MSPAKAIVTGWAGAVVVVVVVEAVVVVGADEAAVDDGPDPLDEHARSRAVRTLPTPRKALPRQVTGHRTSQTVSVRPPGPT
jgi:hypothetical protein